MQKQKDRIILDTNLLISFLLFQDYSKLDSILSQKKVVLLFSQTLIDEFIEVAQRPKFKKYFSASDLHDLLLRISERSIFIDVTTQVSICRDPKDNFLLSLAKDGKASHLITGDNDLLTIKKYQKTAILTLTEYLSKK
jgi:putative PIN family toxin of toxin-antitoxin system